MKIFKTEEAFKKHKDACCDKNVSCMGKYDSELVMVAGKKVLLAGTPLVDDDVFSSIAQECMESFNQYSLANATGKLDEEDIELQSTIRDSLNEIIMKELGIERIEYISEEY